METFTFLFTDIEGSTILLGRVGQDVYARVLADHHSIIRSGLAEFRAQAEEIVVAAARAGATVRALGQIVAEIRYRTAPPTSTARPRTGAWSWTPPSTVPGCSAAI